MKSEKSCHVRPWMRFLGYCTAAILIGALFAPARAQAAALILNEYNAVDNAAYLNGGSYKADLTKEDTYFGTVPGMPDGRLEGNGGNWIELVVIDDHLDIRGWHLRWAEAGANSTDGSDIWFGDTNVEQGVITFSPAAELWSDLRSGTIITISEKKEIGVDTDWDGGLDDRNFTDGVDPGDVDVTIDLSTDTASYDPFADNWWIHLSSRQEEDDGTLLVSTVTNVAGDGPGDFSIGPDDWQLSIFDDADTLVFGPIGEDIKTFGDFPGGITDEETGRLETDPAGSIDNDDFDDATSSTFGLPNEWGGNTQDFSALRAAIPEPGTIVLLCGGGLMLLMCRCRRSVRSQNDITRK